MISFPTTNDEVSQLLRNRSNAPLHISGTAEDRQGSEIISLAQLNSVLFYEPEEMIISVQAGIPLHDLQKTLASKGQWIPTLVASESSEETLGAAIAADHFHPRTLHCGALRTSILGGTFSTTNGEIFKSGSRVVKSVAGYDIHRAFCGSHGLFGIMLDLTLKVLPLPELFYRFFAPIEAKEKLLKFHPSCFEEYSGKLLVESSGYQEDILFDIEEIKSIGIITEELDDNSWNRTVKELIKIRDRSRNNIRSDMERTLLNSTRRVFDPDGILI